jgi:hypothetical protein
LLILNTPVAPKIGKHQSFLAILPMLVAVAACNHVTSTSIEGRIGRAITDRCQPAAKCVIQLREVTPFEWDTVFYFDYVVSPAARRGVVGLPFETAEFQRQLVFLRNGQVVRNDLLPTDVEKPVENELVFEGGKEPNWLSCDRAAEFEVTHDSFGTGVMFFQLKAVSRDSCR